MSDTQKNPIETALKGLKLRGIGPAFMGGRIADIAVHPTKRNTWYLAVGSGGVWKTTNAGISWTPIFDEQKSYSIGCIAIDPSNPETVWVGTGENVSGRHVAWGDGVYRSRNGGKTWDQMGLPSSEHIGKILIDPRDGNCVLVAAEGPLWAAGGERGVYKTIDGGETWSATLEIDENTGVTDIVRDPSNPDTVYAAAYQRRRHIWALLPGGGGSGIHKSTDGGDTWRQITEGLPKEDMGKIGLAVTAADPSIVYATIEANDKEKGFYRSTNRGESWEKRNSYISGGTGPHYYQWIEASPTNADMVYQMDVFVHVTRDGGKTFSNMENGKHKHSDNHALWIDPDDGEHLLLGCDAGLYESFDHGATWRHFPNMPVSQFYRLAIDNAEPFYNIIGGAQDLGSLYGPSRTQNVEGVRNQDWYVPLGADGYHAAFDPNDPNTMYLTWQTGNIYRYDKASEEALDIKPLPQPGEPPERWNWDAPFVISPHSPTRLYLASHRLWRSDDRGNSWTALSGDLTRGANRYEMPLVGRTWSVDSLYDNFAMSAYSSASNLCESALVEGLIYVGTDDGLVQVSEDGGATWRVAADLPGVPELPFIQSVRASEHDANTVFVVADSHKIGDYSPYIFESNDRGKSWHSIAGDLPDGEIVWAIEQDHKVAELLFISAETALHVSFNGGDNWHKLNGGVPTIAFRDLKIHRRDDDLIGASFGRGFYILDDLQPLREIASGALDGDAHVFGLRDAWWYVPHAPMQSPGQPTLGSTSYVGDNPPFGAVFTYYLAEKLQTTKQVRNDAEKELKEAGDNTPFPGWETLRSEKDEAAPQVALIVRDAAGNSVRRIAASADAGLHRVDWDLRGPVPDAIDLSPASDIAPWRGKPKGALLPPGAFSVELQIVHNDDVRTVGTAQTFNVKPVDSTQAGTDFADVSAFQFEVAKMKRETVGVNAEINRALGRLKHMRKALDEMAMVDESLFGRISTINKELNAQSVIVSGDNIRSGLAEPSAPSINQRVEMVLYGHWDTRQNANGDDA